MIVHKRVKVRAPKNPENILNAIEQYLKSKSLGKLVRFAITDVKNGWLVIDANVKVNMKMKKKRGSRYGK